jgi:hypothetical protein
MAVLRWSDSHLDERRLRMPAAALLRLGEANHMLLKFNLGRPSPELIDRNP